MPTSNFRSCTSFSRSGVSPGVVEFQNVGLISQNRASTQFVHESVGSCAAAIVPAASASARATAHGAAIVDVLNHQLPTTNHEPVQRLITHRWHFSDRHQSRSTSECYRALR